MAERIGTEQRSRVAERAGWCCEYCRSQAAFSPDPFSVEHIIPRSRGGSNEDPNLALACQGCNNFKYTTITSVDPLTGETSPLFHPRRDVWSDHFVWNDDATIMLGLSPTGRATIDRLRLNRTGVVNLRRVLKDLGKHPP